MTMTFDEWLAELRLRWSLLKTSLSAQQGEQISASDSLDDTRLKLDVVTAAVNSPALDAASQALDETRFRMDIALAHMGAALGDIDALMASTPPPPAGARVFQATGRGGATAGGGAAAGHYTPAEPSTFEVIGEGGADAGGGGASGRAGDFRFTVGPEAEGITTTSAYIAWELSEPGTGISRYGTSATAVTTPGRTETRLLLRHRQLLTGLVAGRTYYFQIESKNAAGKIIKSVVGSFKTYVTMPEQALAEKFLIASDAPATQRSSPATMIDATGQLAVAAVNEGRVNFDV